MTFDPDAQIVYRGVDELGIPVEWGRFRIVAGGVLGSGGVDVTEVDGVPTEFGGYQLLEPGGYGPANFRFPGITSENFLDYAWLTKGTQFRLEHLNADGELVGVSWPGAADPVPYLWRGFIARRRPLLTGTEVACDGWVTGRASALPHHPRLWHLQKPIAGWVYDALLRSGIQSTPMFGDGLDTTEIDPRDLSGNEWTYIEELLARTLKLDGTSLTVMPNGDSFEQRWKDLTTVHFSAFNGAPGHVLDPEDDILEEPTTIWGQGREPATDDDAEVLVWVNRKDPGLKQGPPPPFPGTLSPGDSSDAVNTLQRKLAGTGFMSRRDTVGGYNDATEDGVRRLQKKRGLPITGITNEATWNAAFDVDDPGDLDLRQSFRMPLAELDEVRKWNYSANGFKIEPNPTHNADRIEVGLDWDFGIEKKSKAEKIADRHLDRVQSSPVWVGTLRLEADVVVGDHGHGSAPEGIMSRLDVVPGMNPNVRNFGADGSTRFHISTVDVDGDLNVTCNVDTKGRDALAVMQIIEANEESRRNPARQWIRQRRGTDAMHAIVEFSETGGEIYNKIDCPANEFTVFPVVAGQSGSINRFQLQTTNSKTEFVCALFAKKPTAGYLGKIGDPFDNNTPVQSLTLNDGGTGYNSAPTVSISGGGGTGAKAVAEVEGGVVTEVRLTQRGRGYTSTPSVSLSGGGGSGASVTANLGGTGSARWTDVLSEDVDSRLMLGAWGDFEQPCGYAPGNKVDFETGDPSGDPITGLFIDTGGFDYWTFEQPVLWVAIYPKNACKLKPQRVLWPVLEAGT